MLTQFKCCNRNGYKIDYCGACRKGRIQQKKKNECKTNRKKNNNVGAEKTKNQCIKQRRILQLL